MGVQKIALVQYCVGYSCLLVVVLYFPEPIEQSLRVGFPCLLPELLQALYNLLLALSSVIGFIQRAGLDLSSGLEHLVAADLLELHVAADPPPPLLVLIAEPSAVVHTCRHGRDGVLGELVVGLGAAVLLPDLAIRVERVNSQAQFVYRCVLE